MALHPDEREHPVRAILLLFLLAALGGCLEQGTGAQGGEDLRASVVAHAQAFLDGDVEGTLRYESDPWVDLGGGSCPYPAERRETTSASDRRVALLAENETPTASPPDASCDPSNITHEERRAALEQFYGSDEHRSATQGRTLADLLDFGKMREEDAASYLAEFSFRGAFTPQEGDVAVHVPGVEGSPFFDGWFGIYRELDGRWVRVAGD